MAVKSGQSIDETTMTASTDATVVNSGDSETKEVYLLSFHDQGGSGGNVELFLSNDDTSASGERIDYIALDPNQRKEAVLAVVNSGKYLIAKPDASDITFHGAYALRNGGDL